MYSKPRALCLVFIIIIISCNSNNEETLTENNIITDTIQQIKIEAVAINSDSITRKLEGEWKEPEYPFRRVHFKNTSVKFVEEGLAEEPTFKEFRILNECPFAVNNVKNATPDDVFLVMEENRTCEIVKILNDILIVSGFNANTSSDYNIYYKKVK